MTDTLTTQAPAASVQLFTSELRPGDHLDQAEFHARYLRTPEGFKAELVEGVVIVPSLLGLAHSDYHADVLGWLKDYMLATPGVKALIGPTVILGPSAEPQPDAILIIEPGRGGKTRIERPEGRRKTTWQGRRSWSWRSRPAAWRMTCIRRSVTTKGRA